MASISNLVLTALAAFQRLESLIKVEVPSSAQSVRSNLSRFKIWAGSLGAHRPYGHRSLEYRLSGAAVIRNHVVALLQEFCGYLTDAEASVGGKYRQKVEDLRQSQRRNKFLKEYFEDDGPDEDEIQQILLQIKNIVDCLMRLAITIRNPAPYEQFRARMPQLVSSFDLRHLEHIEHKFPGLTQKVKDRLGRALTYRRMFFRYREDHNERLNSGIEGEEEEDEHGEDKSKNNATTEASWLPMNPLDGQQDGDYKYGTSIWKDDVSETTATSYAASCLGDSELRVPPIPHEHVDGPFLCPYCYIPIVIENRSQWKKHVFGDLRPYICLEDACDRSEYSFARRKDWISHMTNDHWRTWMCPFGCVDHLTSSLLFFEHIEHEHGLTIATSDIFFHTRPDLERAQGTCPLCGDLNITTSVQYQSHVGTHLEQLALFALPDSEEHREESEIEPSDNESDKADGTDESDEEDERFDTEVLEQHLKVESERHLAKKIKMLEDIQRELEAKVVEANYKALEARNKELEAKQKELEAKQKILEANQKPTMDEKNEPIKEPIKFKDAVGRNYRFPWRLASEWKTMEGLLSQAFSHIDGIGPHVAEGHYDLEGPSGEHILKEVWDITVQPGWEITMKMWPAASLPRIHSDSERRGAEAHRALLAAEREREIRLDMAHRRRIADTAFEQSRAAGAHRPVPSYVAPEDRAAWMDYSRKRFPEKAREETIEKKKDQAPWMDYSRKMRQTQAISESEGEGHAGPQRMPNDRASQQSSDSRELSQSPPPSSSGDQSTTTHFDKPSRASQKGGKQTAPTTGGGQGGSVVGIHPRPYSPSSGASPVTGVASDQKKPSRSSKRSARRNKWKKKAEERSDPKGGQDNDSGAGQSAQANP